MRTENQKKAIIRNVVSACYDISKLSKCGYDFLYQATGFIAHYDIGGFMHYYSCEGNLIADILKNQRDNQLGNFCEHDDYYEKAMLDKEIYNAICEELRCEFDFCQEVA